MEISIDNLWQTISERNYLIQGIGHYIEISIDSLWQRISNYFVKDRHLVAKKSETILSMHAVERHLKIFIESLGLRVSKQMDITWKFL